MLRLQCFSLLLLICTLLPLHLCAQETAPNLPDAIAAWQAELEAAADAGQFQGNVLVARHGTPLVQRAYGLANRDEEIPNQLNTRFNLGSINKMFTALAIVQLAEQGKLQFADHIIQHLPDYPNAEVAEAVTIHHLLTHTSGLGGYAWNHGALYPADILPHFAKDSLAFTPGEQMRYSNAGYVVLGLIIERVSELSYNDYVRTHIFEPAGMMHTSFLSADEVSANRAISYAFDAHQEAWTSTMAQLERQGSPAGGGYSTLADMLGFAAALNNDTLLSPAYKAIYFEGRQAMRGNMQYGYGIGEHTTNGHRSVGHNGGGPGIAADFRIYPELGYTTVLFSNYTSRAFRGLARALEQAIAQ